MESDNITRVINLLIKELRIPVTQQSIEEEIAKHPEYQSMLAISDMLNHWRIPNAAYELTFEELAAAGITGPFIAHLPSKNRQFILVKRMDERQAIIINENGKKQQLSIDEFKDMYAGGAILIAEKETDSGEADYDLKHRQELLAALRIPFVITGAVSILISFLLLHSSNVVWFNWQIALLILFKTAGIVTAVLLLIQSIDSNNPLIQKLCGGADHKDCNAILSSKAAKISGELSWSEVGFFYFGGTWLILLFNSHNIGLMQLLAILNIVSLPYTFYSIYYQWRVAKQWCRFCCTILAIMWLEFFAFLSYISHGVQLPGLRGWASLIIGMAIPVLAWVFIKPYLQLSKQIQPLKQQLRKFKYNADLFNKLLNEEIKYTLPNDEHSIIIGNRQAEHIITIVSNPYCQPCSKAHKALDEWLANRDDIKLQVIFSNQNDENNPRAKVGPHLMSLQATRDDASLKHALNDWYEQKQKDYDAWAKVHPVAENIPAKKALEIQKEWCKTTEIIGTPTIFINGRKLPGNYETEDIKYFI